MCHIKAITGAIECWTFSMSLRILEPTQKNKNPFVNISETDEQTNKQIKNTIKKIVCNLTKALVISNQMKWHCCML